MEKLAAVSENETQPTLEKIGLTSTSKYIVLAPEAASGAVKKNWQAKNWVNVIESILAKPGLEVLVLATRPKLKEILSIDPRVHFFDHTEHLESDVLLLASLLHRSQGVVTLDSGPALLSGFLRKHCITLFGPTYPSIFGHLNNVNLRTSVCPPCMYRQRSRLCTDNVCMTEIKSATVIRLVDDLLNGRYSPR